MTAIIVEHSPNTTYDNHAPGNTSWNKVVVPAGVPIGQPGVHVMMKSRDNTGFANGSEFKVATNVAGAPSDGFMVSDGGQTLSITFDQNLWLQLSVADDTVDLLWGW